MSLGTTGAQFFDIRSNAFGHLLRGISAGYIVRADHQDDELRLKAVEFSMLEPPENILGAVSSNSYANAVERSVMSHEDIPAGSAPSRRDRVAIEYQVHLSLFRHLEILRELRQPFVARHGKGRGIGAGRRSRQRPVRQVVSEAGLEQAKCGCAKEKTGEYCHDGWDVEIEGFYLSANVKSMQNRRLRFPSPPASESPLTGSDSSSTGTGSSKGCSFSSQSAGTLPSHQAQFIG